MFKVGDKAVYPAHGVCVIKGIEEKEISGIRQSFMVLQVVENEKTIMIPQNKVTSGGLRDIIKKDEVKKVYKILRRRDIPVDHQTWNRRYRDYKDKINSGSVFEIAEVLRDLFLLRHEKELSFGEKKMMDAAKDLLIKEISIAKKTDATFVEKEISSIFKN